MSAQEAEKTENDPKVDEGEEEDEEEVYDPPTEEEMLEVGQLGDMGYVFRDMINSFTEENLKNLKKLAAKGELEFILEKEVIEDKESYTFLSTCRKVGSSREPTVQDPFLPPKKRLIVTVNVEE